MPLGSTQYAPVTWTTGDTITETKLDNMVANDQAYDSHASNGYLSNNNVGFYQKDSGAVNRLVANLDGSDVLNIGDSAQAGNTLIQAGTNKFVGIRMRRQGGSATVWDTSGTTNYDAVNASMQAGSIEVASGVSVTVTFPTAFVYDPVVFVQLNTTDQTKTAVARNITATQFVAEHGEGTTRDVLWLAIGQIA